MTDLVAVPSWDAVPQIETNTRLLGGPDGPLNLSAQALLNRSEYLKNNSVPGIIPVGADPTGATFSDAAFAAWAAAIAGKNGTVPAGNYKFQTANIPLAAGTTIDHCGATFDISAAPVGAALYSAAGAEGARYPLTGNATKSTALASMSPADLAASGIAAGDWVRVCSNGVFDASRTNSKIGEQIKIKTVDGATGAVTFETPLVDTYLTADAAVISKMAHLPAVRVRGSWKVIGGNNGKNHKAVTFSICEAPYAEGLTAIATDDRALYFLDCVFPKAHACHFEDFQSPGTGYGISVTSATQDGVFTSITSRDVRHLFTTNNAVASPGIPRRIILNGFAADQSAPSTGGAGGDSIDTHAAAEEIHIWNGVVRGSSSQGVNFEARSGSIANVFTYDTVAGGVGVHNETDRQGDIVLSNVHAYRAGTTGVRVNNGAGLGGYDGVVAHNVSGTDCGGVAVQIDGTAAKPVQFASLAQMQAIRSGSAVAGVYIQCINGGSLIGAASRDATQIAHYGIRLRDLKNFTATHLTGKLPNGATGSLVYVNGSAAGALDGLVIDHITGESPAAASSRGILVDNNANNVTIGKACRLDAFSTPISWGTGTGHRGGFLRGSAIYDPASIADGAGVTTTVTVTGAALGDNARATFSLDLQGITLTAWVSAANTVSVRFQNESGAAVDLASGTIKAIVEKI